MPLLPNYGVTGCRLHKITQIESLSHRNVHLKNNFKLLSYLVQFVRCDINQRVHTVNIMIWLSPEVMLETNQPRLTVKCGVRANFPVTVCVSYIV